MMKQKTVLILYEEDKDGENKSFLKDWEDLYSYGRKNNVLFCRAPITAFNKNKKCFSQAEFFDEHWFFQKNITPDLIYDKSTFSLPPKLMRVRREIEKAFPFYNPLELSRLLSDKWLTYKSFSDSSPKAVLIKNKQDLPLIKNLHSDKIIFKPQSGSGGKGIKIFNRVDFCSTVFPFFAQELIEVKRGIKNFVTGPHDLRIMIANEKIFYAYLRIPKKGHLISNLSQGGTIRVIPLKKLPSSVIPFIKKIQNKLKKYKIKLYSVDIILDDNAKPWIIEMNSRPGLVLAEEEKDFREYFLKNILNFFKKIK